MNAKGFLQGFVAVLIPLGLLTLALQLFLTKVGEIDLRGVVERQLADDHANVLFLSGINQQAYQYKMMLFDNVKPQVIVVGASRAMQLRGKFFTSSFINLGGATNNVDELELLAAHLSSSNAPSPQLAFVFVDPWWFNARYPGSRGGSEASAFPKIVSADIVLGAASALKYGNWAVKSLTSKNLGIYALVWDAGYSKDGGYNYVGTISGRQPSPDIKFADTFSRIDGDRDVFEKNDHADPTLVSRTCAALASIERTVRRVVVIAPPYPSRVWQRMMQGGYDYIGDAYAKLHACSSNIEFFNFSDPTSLPDSTDCEFIDGIHGGNTTAARMLNSVATADPEIKKYLDTSFIDQFVQRFSGFAGGVTLTMYGGLKEVDFLHLGCVKNPKTD